MGIDRQIDELRYIDRSMNKDKQNIDRYIYKHTSLKFGLYIDMIV